MLFNSHNLELKHPGTKKLLPHGVGPFIVERRIGPVAYRLELPNSMHTIHPVFHASKLAKYRMDGQCQPPPPLIELEGELEYEVEKILDKRMCKVGRHNCGDLGSSLVLYDASTLVQYFVHCITCST